MIAVLDELQAGYTNFPCFLCLWDALADDQHYLQKECPVRESLSPGVYNVKADSLINSCNIYK